MGQAQEQRDSEFSRCFEREMPRLLRYAQRHVGPELAQDVVADTFQIAWRKWDELPEVKFPWLVGTARRVIGNHVRSMVRRRRLTGRLSLLAVVTEDAATEPTARIEALRRLAALSEVEREALLLVAWDGLTAEQAAAVLRINPATFRKRLSRARAALAAAGEPQPHRAGAHIGSEEEC